MLTCCYQVRTADGEWIGEHRPECNRQGRQVKELMTPEERLRFLQGAAWVVRFFRLSFGRDEIIEWIKRVQRSWQVSDELFYASNHEAIDDFTRAAIDGSK